jgi:hypothetical protein
VNDIRVYEDWPKEKTRKVPSLSSYTPSPKGCSQWGHDIDENSAVMRWTKLKLEPSDLSGELKILQDTVKGLRLISELNNNGDLGIFDSVPIHLTKTFGDVVSDYLSKVTRCWHDKMLATAKKMLSHVPLDVVVTHPAVRLKHFPVVRCTLLTYSCRYGLMRRWTQQ